MRFTTTTTTTADADSLAPIDCPHYPAPRGSSPSTLLDRCLLLRVRRRIPFAGKRPSTCLLEPPQNTVLCIWDILEFLPPELPSWRAIIPWTTPRWRPLYPRRPPERRASFTYLLRLLLLLLNLVASRALKAVNCIAVLTCAAFAVGCALDRLVVLVLAPQGVLHGSSVMLIRRTLVLTSGLDTSSSS